MAKVITMTDDETGVTTTFVVARGADGTPQIREFSITTAKGAGLQPADLDLTELQLLGLAPATPAIQPPAPTPAPEPTPAPAPAARTRRRQAKPLGRAGKVDKLGRGYRRAPDVEELQRLFTEHGGPSGVARALGVPAHSVAGWLRRYRADGHVFELAVA